MTRLVALPILVPLATAVGALLAGRRPRLQARIALTGAVLLLLAGVALVVDVYRHGVRAHLAGDRDPPHAIALVADPLSALLVATTGLLGVCVVAYSRRGVDRRRKALGYHPMLQCLLLGICGVLLAGDLFNLFVWFEVMLAASFVLLVLGGERAQLEGGLKYVVMNLLGSLLLLAGIGLVYGLTGTLNLGSLRGAMADVPRGIAVAIAALFLVALGIKAAAFPLFTWLPAAYPAAPVAVGAIFAGLLTKVGAYAMLRLSTLVFAFEGHYFREAILVVAGLTMATGVLGAMVQMDLRRLLAFHVVSQVGYLLMGVGLGTRLAYLGVTYFMVHVILAKAALFLVAGTIHALRGTFNLRRLGGIARDHPGVAAAFLAPALSLAGIPPLSGFVGKLALVRAGLDAGAYGIVAVAVAVSLLTLYSMIKVWTLAFWGEVPGAVRRGARAPASLLAPAVALAAVGVAIGIGAQPVVELGARAAEVVADPAAYVRAVAGGAP